MAELVSSHYAMYQSNTQNSSRMAKMAIRSRLKSCRFKQSLRVPLTFEYNRQLHEGSCTEGRKTDLKGLRRRLETVYICPII